MTLEEYLRGRRPQGFSREPTYLHGGDLLTCFASEDEAYIEQLSPWLGVYRSMKTGEVVGVKVYGVMAAVRRGCIDAAPQEG